MLSLSTLWLSSSALLLPLSLLFNIVDLFSLHSSLRKPKSLAFGILRVTLKKIKKMLLEKSMILCSFMLHVGNMYEKADYYYLNFYFFCVGLIISFIFKSLLFSFSFSRVLVYFFFVVAYFLILNLTHFYRLKIQQELLIQKDV